MRLRFLSAGESHGRGLVVIVEGMVSRLPLRAQDINRELERRRGGVGRGERMKLEEERVEIISGVRYGYTLGSPIALFIPNKEWQKWLAVMSPEEVAEPAPPITRPRPGHADLAGLLKYGFEDIRDVLERASARETASRVACGAIVKKFLAQFDIKVLSHTINIGGEWAQEKGNWELVENSPIRCADPEAEERMLAKIREAEESGESLGGIFEVIAFNVPPGLGSYVHWDRRLDARLAGAVMSIPAVKGVEVGAGFEFARLKGSQAHDIILPGLKRASNRAGGIEGGVSNGQPIVLRGVVKPIPTIRRPLPSIDLKTGEVAGAFYERADVCVVPSAGVIAEAVVAWELTNEFLLKFGGDSLPETKQNFEGYKQKLSKLWGEWDSNPRPTD